MITSFGLGEERASLCVLVHLFVYFARVDFCPSSKVGGGGLLRHVIVALSGLFYYFFREMYKLKMDQSNLPSVKSCSFSQLWSLFRSEVICLKASYIFSS